MDINNLTIKKAHDHLKAGDFSVKDLIHATLKNVEEKNPKINAYLEVYDDVEIGIKKAEELFKSGKASLLTGIPIALKDNILNKGKIASASSKILENYHATYDATAVSKLKAENPIFIG